MAFLLNSQVLGVSGKNEQSTQTLCRATQGSFIGCIGLRPALWMVLVQTVWLGTPVVTKWLWLVVPKNWTIAWKFRGEQLPGFPLPWLRARSVTVLGWKPWIWKEWRRCITVVI